MYCLFYYLVLQQGSVVSQCVCLNSVFEGLPRCGVGSNHLSDLLLSITFFNGHTYDACYIHVRDLTTDLSSEDPVEKFCS